MATPTITIAQTPTSGSGPGAESHSHHHHHHRLHAHASTRNSLKTGSVRHLIKNLASLSSSSGAESLSSLPPSPSSSSMIVNSQQLQNNGSNNNLNNNIENVNNRLESKSSSPPEEVSPVRKHIIEEINDDSVYSIQLKKITYSMNSHRAPANSNLVTKCDQTTSNRALLSGTLQRNGLKGNAYLQQQAVEDNQQSLQWETRQLRTIKGATLEHLVKYVLFMTPAQRRLRQSHRGRNKPSHGQSSESSSSHSPPAASSTPGKRHHKVAKDISSSTTTTSSTTSSSSFSSDHHHRHHHHHHNHRDHHSDTSHDNHHEDAEDDDDDDDEDPRYVEERNNVAHAMHVLFATYRQFAYPWALFEHIIRQRPAAGSKQFNFILYYWLNNYPEDFWTSQQQPAQNSHTPTNHSQRSASRSSMTKTTPTSIATIHSNGSSSSSSLGHHPGDSNSLETSEDGSSLYSEYTVSSNSSSGASFFPDSSASSAASLMASSAAGGGGSPLTLADQLIAMRQIDEDVKKHCLHLLDMKKDGGNGGSSGNGGAASGSTSNHAHNRSLSQLYSSPSSGSASSGSSSSSSQKSIQKTSSILDLDAKFIAQQLTAIDLENFLTLKPYTLLSNVRSKTKIETMIRNFNLLSRHVIVTILQSPTPHLVAQHWIDVAQQLRKMRNFNSLKATIAGLTNESIHRLKSSIWNKLSRTTLSAFQQLSSIVDDVNNQTLLRHTQLFIEGTSKVALDESFGTIPYLGTFLTDITMINTRYANHLKTAAAPPAQVTNTATTAVPASGELQAADKSEEKKLINFEKCAKQYEILMQMQLLQKNAIAALQQQQQQNYHLGPIYSLNHYLSLRSQTVPSIPRVARIFRNWFQLSESDMLNDKECYQISLNIEPNVSKARASK